MRGILQRIWHMDPKIWHTNPPPAFMPRAVFIGGGGGLQFVDFHLDASENSRRLWLSETPAGRVLVENFDAAGK